MRSDPDYYDAESAGWWIWFVSCWIGGLPVVPENGKYGSGGGENGVYQKLPHLGGGQGVHRQRPHLGGGGRGNGVHANPPGYTNDDDRLTMLKEYMSQLSNRLRRVRICCGDWTRVLGPTVTFRHGLTSIFLDPPYSHAERQPDLYSHDNDVAADVRQWCIENGDNPLLRIALCGYRGEGHEQLEDLGWQPYYWKTQGGYGNQANGNSRGKENRNREVIWFSPYCLQMEALPLFAHANSRAQEPAL
jgi:hypothetical protein